MPSDHESTPASPQSLKARPSAEAAPAQHFDGEDFLFHLYRGSELLQDNRIAEAKEELETALAMQPRDIEGQGLLGVVYFRLGMYPHAMEIYEELVRTCPKEIAPRINLALCYLKTGQLVEARSALELVISLVPEHQRAWGYLGLVFERLGDHAKAQVAFDRAGQPHLARRMEHILEEKHKLDAEPGPAPGQLPPAVMQAAEGAAEELERGEAAFHLAQSTSRASSRSGRWQAVELGQAKAPDSSRSALRYPPPSPAPGSLRPAAWGSAEAARSSGATLSPGAALSSGAALSASQPFPGAAGFDAAYSTTEDPSMKPLQTRLEGSGQHQAEVAPLLLGELLQSARIAPSPHETLHAYSPDLFVLTKPQGFHVRGSAIFSFLPQGNVAPPLPSPRRAQGLTQSQPLGGEDPLFHVLGPAQLALGVPRTGESAYRRERQTGQRLYCLELGELSLYLREALLVGFDSSIQYECGRFGNGQGEPEPLVKLTGPGQVVFLGGIQLEALECNAEAPVWAHLRAIIGWSGRLVPQTSSVAHPGNDDAANPNNQQGALFPGPSSLVRFSGDGSVLTSLSLALG